MSVLSGRVPQDLSLNSLACNHIQIGNLPEIVADIINQFVIATGNVVSSPGNTEFFIISTVDLPANNSNIYLYNSAANRGYHLLYDNSANTFRLVNYPTGTDILEADTANVHIFTSQVIDGNLIIAGTISGGATWQGNAIGTLYGGTGLTSYSTGDILYASGVNVLSRLPANLNPLQYFLMSQNGGAPVWAPGSSVVGAPLTVTNDVNIVLVLSGDPTSALVNATDIEVTWSGVLDVSRGGTGIGTYTLGDMLYASAPNVLSKLASNPLGTPYYLTSQNGAAPSWTSIGSELSIVNDTNVTLNLYGTPTQCLVNAATITVGWSGALSDVRGGTGNDTYTDGELLIGNALGGLTKTTLTEGDNITITNGNGSISIATNPLNDGHFPPNIVFTSITANEIKIQNSTLIPSPTLSESYTLSLPRPIYYPSAGGFFQIVNLDGNGDLVLETPYLTITINGPAPNLTFTGSTMNFIQFDLPGVGIPTFTSRSPGTKIILNNTLSATDVDVGIGLDTNALWYSVPRNTAAYQFKWFGGATEIYSLDGDDWTIPLTLSATTLTSTSVTTPEANLYGTVSTNSVSLTSTTTTDAYNLALPSSQGLAGTQLINDGTGVLRWTTGVSFETVTIDGAAPNLIMDNATSNMINFGTNGAAPPDPTQLNPTNGTKIIVYDAAALFSIAVDTSTMYFPQFGNNFYGLAAVLTSSVNIIEAFAGIQSIEAINMNVETGFSVNIQTSTTVSNNFTLNTNNLATPSITLPTVGGTPTALSTYTQGTATTFTVTGPFAGTPNVTVKISRIGKMVTVIVDEFSVAATSSSNMYDSVSNVLPAPVFAFYTTITTINNSSSQVGSCTVNASGRFQVFFFVDVFNTNTAAGNCGHMGFRLSYLVA